MERPLWRKYRKKPVIIEAARWFKISDIPDIVLPYPKNESPCPQCDKLLSEHGLIETLEGQHIVCPGDWIIRGIHGEYYPVKPEIFTKTYEEVSEE